LEKYAPLWQEYARCFKGRKQLNFSPGLKKLYGLKDDEDAELAAEGEIDAAVTLVEVSPAQWDQVVEAKARGGLRELIHSGRPGYIVAGLAEIGIEASPTDMTSWKVSGPDGPGEVDQVWADSAAPGGWYIRLWLDDPGGGNRWRSYALWDVEVLSDGARERAALLSELDSYLEGEKHETNQQERPAGPGASDAPDRERQANGLLPGSLWESMGLPGVPGLARGGLGGGKED
jgi:hypothetical protein